MITVFRTIEEFESLKDNWDELFSRSSSATPYQTWQFVNISWRIWHGEKDRLYIIGYKQKAKREQDAIIPCYIDKEDKLHLMDYMTDFSDGIIPDQLLENYDMYEEIVQCIEQDHSIRSVCFVEMRQESRLMAYLYGLGAYSKTTSTTGYTIVRMNYAEENKDFVDGIRSCNCQHRRTLRKQIKKSEGLQLSILEGSEPYPDQAIRQLGDYMISIGKRTSEYLSDSFYNYFRQLYENGQLLVALLWDNDELCACNFFLVDRHANEFVSWVVLYKMNHHNTALMLFSLDYMYKHDFYNLNFARGVYAYKLQNFHPEVHVLQRLTIYRSKRDAYKDTARTYWQKLKRLIIRIKKRIKSRLKFV